MLGAWRCLPGEHGTRAEPKKPEEPWPPQVWGEAQEGGSVEEQNLWAAFNVSASKIKLVSYQ